jgi:hypothetical protein
MQRANRLRHCQPECHCAAIRAADTHNDEFRVYAPRKELVIKINSVSDDPRSLVYLIRGVARFTPRRSGGGSKSRLIGCLSDREATLMRQHSFDDLSGVEAGPRTLKLTH